MGYFGRSAGPILYSKVECTGTELALQECMNEQYDANICGHEKDVGIVCRGE